MELSVKEARKPNYTLIKVYSDWLAAWSFLLLLEAHVADRLIALRVDKPRVFAERGPAINAMNLLQKICIDVDSVPQVNAVVQRWSCLLRQIDNESQGHLFLTLVVCQLHGTLDRLFKNEIWVNQDQIVRLTYELDLSALSAVGLIHLLL